MQLTHNHNIQVIDDETKQLFRQYIETQKPVENKIIGDFNEPRFRIRTASGTDINIPTAMLKVGFGIGIGALVTISVCKVIETIGNLVGD